MLSMRLIETADQLCCSIYDIFGRSQGFTASVNRDIQIRQNRRQVAAGLNPADLQ